MDKDKKDALLDEAIALGKKKDLLEKRKKYFKSQLTNRNYFLKAFFGVLLIAIGWDIEQVAVIGGLITTWGLLFGIAELWQNMKIERQIAPISKEISLLEKRIEKLFESM